MLDKLALAVTNVTLANNARAGSAYIMLTGAVALATMYVQVITVTRALAK